MLMNPSHAKLRSDAKLFCLYHKLPSEKYTAVVDWSWKAKLVFFIPIQKNQLSLIDFSNFRLWSIWGLNQHWGVGLGSRLKQRCPTFLSIGQKLVKTAIFFFLQNIFADKKSPWSKQLVNKKNCNDC